MAAHSNSPRGYLEFIKGCGVQGIAGLGETLEKGFKGCGVWMASVRIRRPQG